MITIAGTDAGNGREIGATSRPYRGDMIFRGRAGLIFGSLCARRAITANDIGIDTMDALRLLQAAELVGELAENFDSLPEGGETPARAAAALAVARLYMLRYARHLTAGREPYEALKACVEDEQLVQALEEGLPKIKGS